MWIVPKTLSAFVPDTEGLNLGLDERAWMLEQSAMWRSKPSSKQTLVAKIEEGRMDNAPIYSDLKTFPAEIFRGKVHGLIGGYPCQPFSRRESEKEKKTQGTYGHTSEDTSGQLDLFGASLKMSEDTPRWGYGESCPIWKKMVTERSGDCSARRKQARLTNASEFHLGLPHTASGHRQGSQGLKGRHFRSSSQQMAHTASREPRQSQARNGGQDIGGGSEDTRWPARPEKSSTSGKNHGSWPTARSSDAEGGRIKTERTEKGFRSKREKSDQYFGAKLRDAAEMEKPPTMKLNPNWCEQLMGLPIGWTDLGSWATESSHKPQN